MCNKASWSYTINRVDPPDLDSVDFDLTWSSEISGADFTQTIEAGTAVFETGNDVVTVSGIFDVSEIAGCQFGGRLSVTLDPQNVMSEVEEFNNFDAENPIPTMQPITTNLRGIGFDRSAGSDDTITVTYTNQTRFGLADVLFYFVDSRDLVFDASDIIIGQTTFDLLPGRELIPQGFGFDIVTTPVTSDPFNLVVPQDMLNGPYFELLVINPDAIQTARDQLLYVDTNMDYGFGGSDPAVNIASYDHNYTWTNLAAYGQTDARFLEPDCYVELMPSAEDGVFRAFAGDTFWVIGSDTSETSILDTGRNRIEAGAGNDSIVGGQGAEQLDGQDGNDTIRGGAGSDNLTGGAGRDQIFDGTEFDTISAGSGDDIVDGGLGRDLVFLNQGNDLYLDNAQGGELGRDTVFTGFGDDTVQGGNGDDLFFGEDGNDVINGRLGNDTIFGGGQFDTISAGAGNDEVHGGNGRDLVFLNQGDDIFFDNGQSGALGNDTVYSGFGNDTIQGGHGDNVYFGEDGNDLIIGRLGNDLVFAGNNFDTVSSGGGNDTVYGGDGRDLIYLNQGDDLYIDNGQGGELGRDTVYTGFGNDTLAGGAGMDTLNGGDGAESFVFVAADASTGTDLIEDFALGTDVFEVRGAAAGDVTTMFDAATGRVTVNINGDAAALITSVGDLTGFGLDDILFV